MFRLRASASALPSAGMVRAVAFVPTAPGVPARGAGVGSRLSSHSGMVIWLSTRTTAAMASTARCPASRSGVNWSVNTCWNSARICAVVETVVVTTLEGPPMTLMPSEAGRSRHPRRPCWPSRGHCGPYRVRRGSREALGWWGNLTRNCAILPDETGPVRHGASYPVQNLHHSPYKGLHLPGLGGDLKGHHGAPALQI